MYLSALLSSNTVNKMQNGKAPQTLTQYLKTRVWDLWDNETKTFLLKLAIPAEITVDLCKRLTGKKDSKSILENLRKKENAFLSLTEKDTYRFHDIFHEFLLEQINHFINKEEIQKLNDIAAQWYYEQGDYHAGARHYINNRNHDGLCRCISASNRFNENTAVFPVEQNVHFTMQYVIDLPSDFINKNPYLISECLFMDYLNGNTKDFLKHEDILYKMIPGIMKNFPEHMETVVFESALDFRIPLNEYIKQIEPALPSFKKTKNDAVAHTNTITQNLPFFHRSMRDYSEYYELKPADIKRIRNTFGMMIGRDYEIMEQLIYAGLYYEKGNLLDALRHAINGYNAYKEDMNLETFFCVHTHLAYVLYAMGSMHEADKIMILMKDYIERNAQFLKANFKALQTERSIRNGDIDSAKEWLTVYACRTKHLPFYQICRHFTTMRSYIATGDFAAAAAFGRQLHTLAVEYNRPLDQIESGILTAIALFHNGKKSDAVKQFMQAVKTAAPYGYIQLFINEGKEVLPLLWEFKKSMDKNKGLLSFTDKLISEIYKRYNFTPKEEKTPKLPPQQLTMLSYLNKGLTYSEIAKETGIERSTVKYHVLQMYKRLNVHDAKEAIVKAKHLRLIE